MIRQLLELKRILNNRKLSPEELEALRARKLRAVIRNAYHHVPYYQSLFQSAGISPEDIRTVQDLRKIPITTKDQLRSAGPEDTIAEWAVFSSLLPRKTGGSTGKPFTVYRTTSEDTTVGLLHVAAMLTCGHRPLDRFAIMGFDWPTSQQLHHRLGLYRREVLPVSMPVAEQIRRLQEFRPTVIMAVPSVLRALVHSLPTPMKELVQPRVLITGGEVFDEVLRKRVRSELDAEIFDSYGAMECGRIAWECRSHEGMHVNVDHVVMECVDGEDPVEAGKPGLAVVTSLFAFGMPFIRYKLGDLCQVVNKTCSCGCMFPLMDHPLGRENDVLTLPSGNIKSPKQFDLILEEFEGIDQWRVVQESEKKFVLYLVMPNKPDRGMLEKIRREFLGYLEERVTVDIRLVDYIEEEVLKFRTFISKVPPLP